MNLIRSHQVSSIIISGSASCRNANLANSRVSSSCEDALGRIRRVQGRHANLMFSFLVSAGSRSINFLAITGLHFAEVFT
jgi:hypothetical protein